MGLGGDPEGGLEPAVREERLANVREAVVGGCSIQGPDDRVVKLCFEAVDGMAAVPAERRRRLERGGGAVGGQQLDEPVHASGGDFGAAEPQDGDRSRVAGTFQVGGGGWGSSTAFPGYANVASAAPLFRGLSVEGWKTRGGRDGG